MNTWMPAWLRWTTLAVVTWAAWAVLSKVPGERLSPGMSQALSTLGLLPMVPFLWKAPWRGASPRGLGLALAGGIVTCLGNVSYYSALAAGGKAALVVPLTALYPLVTILLAVVFLRERLSWIQGAGLVLSLAAIWLFNIPDGSGLWSGAVIHALPPILLWGLSGFLQKLSTGRIAAETAAVVYLLSFIPVGLYYAVREPWPAPFPASIWLAVLGMGFFLAFGNYAMLAAFAQGGKAAIIAPLGGLYPLLSVPAAVVIFHERIGPREIAGLVLAVLAVLALSVEPRTKPDP